MFGLFGALFSYSGKIGFQVYVVVGSPEIIHFSVEISLVFEKLFVSKELLFSLVPLLQARPELQKR